MAENPLFIARLTWGEIVNFHIAARNCNGERVKEHNKWRTNNVLFHKCFGYLGRLIT